MFGKKKAISFVAPLTGTMVAISEVPDATFAEKMMGDGVAIKPTSGDIVSPCDGTVTAFFHTKHAIGITNKDGVQILIHVGLDTVSLNGEGFEGFVTEGQTVKKGDRLLHVDLEKLKEAGLNSITPVIVLEHESYKKINCGKFGNVTQGIDEVFSVVTK